MLDRSSAGRYAQALFELARPSKADAAVEQALVEVSAALKSSPETERLLMDPRLTLAEKRNTFSRIFSTIGEPAAGLLVNFFSVLFEKHRFGLVHDIAEAFKKISDAAQGESVALVRTAVPLDAPTQARLLAALEKRTGTKVVIRNEVTPSILGGVEVLIGNQLIDGSVRGNISGLKETLLRRR